MSRLNGTIPVPPPGVLTDARASGSRWLTWQPAPGVREAAVVVSWRGGTVLVGRSLKPTKDRENDLGALMGAG